MELRRGNGELLEEGEFDGVAGGGFDAGQPQLRAIGQLVELAGGDTEDAAGVVRGVAAQDGAAAVEAVNEKATAHGGIEHENGGNGKE